MCSGVCEPDIGYLRLSFPDGSVFFLESFFEEGPIFQMEGGFAFEQVYTLLLLQMYGQPAVQAVYRVPLSVFGEELEVFLKVGWSASRYVSKGICSMCRTAFLRFPS